MRTYVRTSHRVRAGVPTGARAGTRAGTLTVLAAVGAACAACAGGVPSGALAVAEGHTLSVDEAVRILAAQSQLPARPEVVEAVGDLWIDYTLLAIAAQEDSTFGHVDLTPIVQRRLDQDRVYELRRQVIQVDTTPSEEELRRLYDEERPGTRVNARHILLTVPNEGAQDSVLSLARALRERVLTGESFASLASEFSSDPGSAANGGELGYFRYGDMLEPFAEAVFELDPGELSEPVRTEYGVHLIQLLDRHLTPFDSARGGFLNTVKNRRIAGAESTYVAAIEGPADPRVEEGAPEAIRGLARRPHMITSGRAARRPLVRYRGGSYQASDFQEYIQTRSPAFREQIVGGSDEQLEELLLSLSRAKLLVDEADRRGIEVPPARVDTVMTEARNVVIQAARALDLRTIEVDEGETPSQALDRTVLTTLEEMLRGERDVIPLGAIGFALRRSYSARLNDASVERVVAGWTGDTASEGSDGGAASQPPTPRDR